MLTIIKEREIKELIDKRVDFNYLDDPNAGFSFPGNDTGGVDFDKMPEAARENYRWCIANSDKVSGPHYITYNHTYTEPAVGKCSCGAEVVLENTYMGATCCEKCGQWYNLFGQELKDPKYWEENY